MEDLAKQLPDETLEGLEQDLMRRAFLADVPAVYREAVTEVFETLRATLAAATAAA